MDWPRVITLVGVSYIEDSIGQRVPQEAPRNVFCDIASVSASEWFEGGKAGLNPTYRAVVFAPDYQGEQIAELDGVRYGIYRTFLGRGDTIELYMERKAGI